MSTSNTDDEAIYYGIKAHAMYPHYKSFLPYCCDSNGYCVTLGNGEQEKNPGYGTILVLLGGGESEKLNVFNVPGMCVPLYSLPQNRRLPGCGYLCYN